jgi:hypothetical protein
VASVIKHLHVTNHTGEENHAMGTRQPNTMKRSSNARLCALIADA